MLGVSKTDKSLTKIKFTNNRGHELIVVGRPLVHGELKAQLSHIIPYGLINQLVKSVISSDNTFSEKLIF